MIIRRDEAFRVVCEILTPVNVNEAKVGTGIFVCSPAGINTMYGWIVTADHVAKETTNDTKIVIANQAGKATNLPLTLFGKLSNWRHHPIADISAFRIELNSLNEPYLDKRFLPLDHFNLEENAVSRDYELTSIGFPKGLGKGKNDYFSPFSFRSYASSGFVTLLRADTNTPSTFFCMENPSVGGYSGCPVFDLGYETNGVMTSSRGQTWCHGIMHGTMSDDTGGKIAMVTPAFYLKDIIV